MRSRARLIEVLQTVNPDAPQVGWAGSALREAAIRLENREALDGFLRRPSKPSRRAG